MPNYYIFGNNNIHLNIDLLHKNVTVKIDNNMSNFTLDEFERAVKDLQKYLEDLKKWNSGVS